MITILDMSRIVLGDYHIVPDDYEVCDAQETQENQQKEFLDKLDCIIGLLTDILASGGCKENKQIPKQIQKSNENTPSHNSSQIQNDIPNATTQNDIPKQKRVILSTQNGFGENSSKVRFKVFKNDL